MEPVGINEQMIQLSVLAVENDVNTQMDTFITLHIPPCGKMQMSLFASSCVSSYTFLFLIFPLSPKSWLERKSI